jgi:hypothetical protein
MLRFIGGEDNRRRKGGDDDLDENGNISIAKARANAPQGTYTNSAMTIDTAARTWTVQESGGHQYPHARAHNAINASGTFTVSSDKTTYSFFVAEYENSNSNARAPPTQEKGKTVVRTADEIQNGAFKSLFFGIPLT